MCSGQSMLVIIELKNHNKNFESNFTSRPGASSSLYTKLGWLSNCTVYFVGVLVVTLLTIAWRTFVPYCFSFTALYSSLYSGETLLILHWFSLYITADNNSMNKNYILVNKKSSKEKRLKKTYLPGDHLVQCCSSHLLAANMALNDKQSWSEKAIKLLFDSNFLVLLIIWVFKVRSPHRPRITRWFSFTIYNTNH